MWLIELLPYRPFAKVSKVRNEEEAIDKTCGDSQYILINTVQFAEMLRVMKPYMEKRRK